MEDFLIELIGNSIIILIFFGPIALIIYFAVRNTSKKSKNKQKINGNFNSHNTPPLSSLPIISEEKGTFGEYLLVKALKEMPGEKRILTNCYIPKDNGTTTELDIVMIHETGIYVIESKNFSGWIFGNEENMYWTLTFPNGKKYQFYNPIWQNKNHIKHLRNIIGNDFYYYSFVVFGKNCELRNISNHTNTAVCDEYTFKGRLYATLTSAHKSISPEKIKSLYMQLSEYEYITKDDKNKHIHNIKGGLNG